jgi:ABC-type phosphate transport system substrate-binding protein
MRKEALLLWGLMVCLLLQPRASWGVDPTFVVVAAPGTTDRKLTREEVARIFLKKQVFWRVGGRTTPVNLPVTHPLRRQFSQSVLGESPEAFEDYWRDMYFHGVLPPHVLASEEAVVLFVASTPGAVGYVSSCAAAQKLSIVLVVGEVADCQR